MIEQTSPHNVRTEIVSKTRKRLIDEGAWIHPSLIFEENGNEITMRISPKSEALTADTVLMFIPKRFCCVPKEGSSKAGNFLSKSEILVQIATYLYHPALQDTVHANIKTHLDCCPRDTSHLPLSHLAEEKISDEKVAEILAEWSKYDAEFGMIVKAIYDNEVKEYREYITAHPSSPISLREYVSACLYFNSRAWGEFGLVPLMDLVQHQNRAKCIVLSTFKNGGPKHVELLSNFAEKHPQLEIGSQDPFLLAQDALAPGEELFISYGDKTMVNVLCTYGFVDAERAHIMMNVGGVRMTEACKTFIETKKIPKQFPIARDLTLHPLFLYVNRITLDANFDAKKDYSKGINDMALERMVVCDIISAMQKYETLLKGKIQNLEGKISEKGEKFSYERFYEPLLQIAKVELEVVLKNLDHFKTYWLSFVVPQVSNT